MAPVVSVGGMVGEVISNACALHPSTHTHPPTFLSQIEIAAKTVEQMCNMTLEGYTEITMALAPGDAPKGYVVECKTSNMVLATTETAAAKSARLADAASCDLRYKSGTKQWIACKGNAVVEVDLVADKGTLFETKFRIAIKNGVSVMRPANVMIVSDCNKRNASYSDCLASFDVRRVGGAWAEGA